nr:PREDICTED: uncharacterized protein At4g18490 isoform X1 [Musa acuminata subsp. malaccensis]XP_018686219.1 PREDICTED: uncharacterized protein At4g18490 isoform X1 [Musa acuminata subsp. malaccensis]XP_018686220.1 PREDICTED: uncharacterized protein At4g18490 isoform X1 [Musa acuminata subsp. malaccensis]XP_018686221.1 PREDICTED: uncharacterized protein At4g18490 isoform X1 [Musa acuminata subsp. malaccensis]
MAEQERGAPTSAPKMKSPSIEEDFEKDFLISWKSSKPGKQAMDLDVETVPQNRKSSFNFDKLDDFDLGGDFGKLSSFGMDISDLDFSIPLKKTANANEQESLPRKQDLKKEKFSFAFDFNVLDKFDLDTKLVKTATGSSKCMDDGGPHCSDEMRKHESLSTSTSAHMLEPDGPYHAVIRHGSAQEALCQGHKELLCLDSVKNDTSKEKDSGVRLLDGLQSGNSSPVKLSNSRCCPPNNITGSQDCSSTLQNHEVDEHVITEGSKPTDHSIQVDNEASRNSVKEVTNKHFDASCFQFPISKIPGGATSIINAKSTMPNLLSAASVNRPENSFLEVQNISQKDDKNHLPNSMTSRIKENSNIANSSSNGVINTIIVSERNLTLKRKTSKESLTDPKAFSTLKHINSSPKGRVTSTGSAKIIMPNFLSTASMSSPKNIPFEGQHIFQKDGKKHLPGLMTSRMRKENSSIANFSMGKGRNTVGGTEGNLASNLVISPMTDKPVLLSPSLKMKTLKEPLTDPKAFNTSKQIGSSPERISLVISPGSDTEMVQREENPESSRNDASFQNLCSLNGASELENMDIEVPVQIEDHGNVEKAESCSKELDDLCNMLKKKHDEAKELMVRAVVINNKLLMLNHPMIEEKISFCLYDLFFLVPRYASMFIWTLFLDRQNIRALQRLAASLQSKDYWKT